MKTQHLLSRKFITAMTAILSALLGLGMDWLQEGVFSTIVIAALAIYNGVNYMQKQAEKKVPNDPA